MLSSVGFLIAIGVYGVLMQLGMEMAFGGDKGQFFFGLFVGMPLGSMVALFLSDNIYSGVTGRHIMGLVGAAMSNILGNFLGLIMMDIMGGAIIVLLFPSVVFLTVKSYNAFKGLQWNSKDKKEDRK
jgi:hypothetical protein